MKKSILMLVLASLALPAMAITGNTPQEKFTNAMAVLDGFGIKPIVVQDDIGLDRSFYALSNTSEKFDWVRGIQDKFVNGDFFVKQSGASFTKNNSNNSFNTIIQTDAAEDGAFVQKSFAVVVNTGSNYDYTWEVNGSKVGHKAAIEVDWTLGQWKDLVDQSYPNKSEAWRQAKAEFYLETESVSLSYKNKTEAAYDRFIDDSGFLHRMSDDLDLGFEVSNVIINKAKGLKPTLKDLALQNAAAEIGKGANPVCKDQFISEFVSTACTSVVNKFVSVSSQLSDNIYSPIMYEYQGKTYTHVSPGSNELTTTYTTDNGTVVTANQALSSISHKSGFVIIDEVSNVQHYDNALFDINEIADAYVFLTEEDLTFDDL